MVPGKPCPDHWSYGKLPGGPARHPKHLGSTDQSCSLRGRKVFAGDVNRTHQRKDTACSLQQPAYASRFPIARGKQESAETNYRGGNWENPSWSQAVHGGPGTRLKGEYP